jgi:hypothetical protein
VWESAGGRKGEAAVCLPFPHASTPTRFRWGHTDESERLARSAYAAGSAVASSTTSSCTLPGTAS